LIANISGREQDIVDRKTALKTAQEAMFNRSLY